MRHALGGFLLVAFATCAAAQDDAGKKLAKELEGKYELVGMEVGGAKIDPKMFVERDYEVKDGKLIAIVAKKPDPINFTLDPSKKPGWIDFEEVKPNEKNQKSYGIYKIENGLWTICMSDQDDPAKRPKEFKTVEGTTSIIMVFKKADK